MDDWFGESCRSRRVKDHEGVIEWDRGEFEGLFWYREEVAGGDATISTIRQVENTCVGLKRCPSNGS